MSWSSPPPQQPSVWPAPQGPPVVSAPPPGWYRDPTGRLPWRWWDGASWSPYASAGGEAQWDPLVSDERRARSPGLPAVGTAVASFAVGAGLSLLVIVVDRALGRPGGRAVELLVSELGLWTPLVAAVVLVSRLRGTGSLTEDFGLRFRWADIGLGLAGSIGARSASALALLPVVVAHPRFRAPDQSVFRHYTADARGWAVLALVTCVGAPLVEELFFRGLLQTRLVGRFGPVVGIGVTSVLFGAAHLIGWQGPVTLVYALAVAGGGVALGTIKHLTGRLGTSMVAHSIFNAQALVALAFLS